MAKALFGHVGSGNDLRAAAEVTRLRQRIRELEAEVDRLRLRNAELAKDREAELFELALPESRAVAAGEPALLR
jgi:hypothetical protein